MKKNKKQQAPKKTEYPQQIGLGHRHLQTRREFVGHGLLGGAAMVMAPSILSMLAQKAYGASTITEAMCKASGPATMEARVPFIVLDMALGSCLAGRDVIVGKSEAGQADPITDFRYLGLNRQGALPASEVNSDYGLKLHSSSELLAGLNDVFNNTTVMSAMKIDGVKVKSNIDGMLFANISGNDNSGNASNPIYWIAKSGTKGSITQLAGAGSSNPLTLGNSGPALGTFNAAIRPVQVRSRSDAAGLASAGSIVTELGSENTEAILAATRSMSSSQIQSFSNKSLSEQSKTLVECGYLKTSTLVKDAQDPKNNPDPQADPLTNALEPILATSSKNSDGFSRKVQVISKLVVDGMVAAGTVEQADCDFHAIGLQNQKERCRELGVAIGVAIATAASKEKSIMIYVITDGSASSAPDNQIDDKGHIDFSNEDDLVSSHLMIVYRHNASFNREQNPILNPSSVGRRQVGFFVEKTGGGMEIDTKSGVLTSNSVNTMAQVAIANYMALHGEGEDAVASLVGGALPFAGAAWDKYVGFKKIG